VTEHVRACTPVLYVTDLAASVEFYRLLGYTELTSGQDSEWTFSYLKTVTTGLLLAAGPTVPRPAGPVTLYFQVGDADAVSRELDAAGVPVEHLGYPDHAPGGELKVTDPDGYALLLGQVTGAPPVDRTSSPSTSVLQRAAEATRRRGIPVPRCQIPTRDGACPKEAEIKLADSWGDSVWACLAHGEEVMLHAGAVFLATEDSEGVAAYLRRRAGN
jgi:predicted enzyme related to lactoylglutathione lyase